MWYRSAYTKHMKRGSSPILIVIIVFVLAVVGGVLYLYQTSSPNSTDDTSLPTSVYQTPSTKSSDEMINDTLQDEPSDSPTGETANKYIVYSPEALEEGIGKTRVLFFYANWCPTCIPADKEIQANISKIPEGTVVYRVNYDDSDTDANEKALANKYNITYQHTFVIIDDNGNEIQQWNGGGLERLLSEL